MKTLLCYRRAKILLMFFKLYNINRSQSFLATYMWGKQQQKDPLYRPTFSINLTHNAENTFRSLASSYLNGQCKFGGQPWQQCPSSATLNDHGERSSRNSHLTQNSPRVAAAREKYSSDLKYGKNANHENTWKYMIASAVVLLLWTAQDSENMRHETKT